MYRLRATCDFRFWLEIGSNMRIAVRILLIAQTRGLENEPEAQQPCFARRGNWRVPGICGLFLARPSGILWTHPPGRAARNGCWSRQDQIKIYLGDLRVPGLCARLLHGVAFR